jgi:hypothetical protein
MMMAATVVTINRLVWRKLYALAETRFPRLGDSGSDQWPVGLERNLLRLSPPLTSLLWLLLVTFEFPSANISSAFNFLFIPAAMALRYFFNMPSTNCTGKRRGRKCWRMWRDFLAFRPWQRSLFPWKKCGTFTAECSDLPKVSG